MDIKYFNRYELKYLLPQSVAKQIAQDLRNYLEPDPHSVNGGQYSVTSLYYDSPDHKAYWDKIEGLKFRRKVRIRVYGDQPVTPESNCFVEIKQRVDKVLQKKRVIIPYAAALKLCGSGKACQVAGGRDRAVVQEIQYLSETLRLQPSCIVRYNRLAFNGSEYDVGMRVTFDNNLKYRAHALTRLTPNSADYHYFLPPDWSVMEIKVNNRVPYWLTEFIGKYRCTLRRVSKYCLALESAETLLKEQRIWLHTGTSNGQHLS